MTTIHLADVRIFAFHGMYEGESSVGNEYLINLDVVFDEFDEDFNSIQQTVNYAELFDIVKQRMGVNTHLLEAVCNDIIAIVKERYAYITEAKISIFKLQAAIQNLQGKVGVTIHKKFNG